MRKKYKIHIFIIIFLILISKNTYAIEQNEATIDTKNILEEQQSSFGIKEFLNEKRKYTRENFCNCKEKIRNRAGVFVA